MKKIITIILTSLISIASPLYGQQVIPNGSFEGWENGNYYGYLPIRWYGTNYSLLGYNVKGVFQDSTSPVEGEYSVKLIAGEINVSGTKYKYPGFLSLSDLYHLTGEEIIKEEPTVTGVRFTGRPSRLNGFYKYKGVNNDSLHIFLALTRARDTIATAEWKSSKTVTEWTFFDIPIKYRSSANPDLLNIIFSTSPILKNMDDWKKIQLGSTLEIDNIVFDMERLFKVDFTTNGNPCTGNTITYIASSKSVPAVNWEWKVNNTVIGTTATISIKFPEVLSPTNFTVTLKGESQDLGTDIISKTITIYPKPDIKLIPENPHVCPNKPLTTRAEGGIKYTWNISNVINDQITEIPKPGTYYEIVGTDSNGCQNTASSMVSFYSLDTTNVSANYCENSIFNFFGQELSQPGIYFHNLTSLLTGCDSTIRLTLSAIPSPVVSLLADKTQICAGNEITLSATEGFKSYDWGNGPVANNKLVVTPENSMVYSLTVVSQEGCTSSESIEISVTDISLTTLQHEMCAGDSVRFFGEWIKNAGEYMHTTTHISGCDSTVVLNLVVHPLPDATISASATQICAGNEITLSATEGFKSYDWGNGPVANNKLVVTPENSMVYSLTVVSQEGCTSSESIEISVTDISLTTLQHEMCAGDSVRFFGEWIKNAGEYMHTTNNISGCDSTVVLNLVVHPLPDATISASATQICAGNEITLSATEGFNSYDWGNGPVANNKLVVTPENSMVYSLTVVSQEGCTSSESIEISVTDISLTTLQHEMCEGDSIRFFGEWIMNAGEYMHTTNNISGCDSTVVLNLVVHPLPDATISASATQICAGNEITLSATEGFNSYDWGNGPVANNKLVVTPENSMVYSLTVVSQEGCTSSESIEISVTDISLTTLQHEMCAGDSIRFFGEWIMNAGEYMHTTTHISGCDSTVVLNLVVHPLPDATISASATQICAGNEITLSATEGFKSYDWGNGPVADNTFVITPDVTTTYILTAETENGCPSTDSYTVFVNENAHTVLSYEICEGDSIEIFNKWEKKAGFYSEFLKNIHGCDSLVEITLSVKPLSQLQIIASADFVCPGSQAVLTATPGFDFYDWGDGPKESNQLTVNPVSETHYLVKAMPPNGCFSEQNYTVSIYPAYDIREVVYICPGDSARIFGNWEKTPGIYEKTFSSVNGCDSVVQLTINIFEVAPIDLSASKSIICEGETINLVANEGLSNYLWSTGDQNVSAISVTPSQSLSYKLTVTSENGCQASDSLTISIIGKEITYRQVEICEGDSVQVADKWFKSAGVYTEEFQTSAGCIGAMEITVVSNPVPDLMLMSDKETICEGNSVTLSASVGWDNYQWNGGQGSGAIFTITPEKSGFVSLHAMTKKGCMKTDSLFIQLLPTDRTELFYTICETDSAAIFDRWEKYQGEYTQSYINQNGCDSIVHVILEVLPLPQPGLRADNLLICEGETINLVANEGLSNYLWSTGDQNVSAISVTPSQSLSYKLTVTSENGCQASDSLTISIIGKEITYRQVEICEGDSVQVADKWFKSAGVYTEEFQTSAGCIGAMEITVVSNPVPDLILLSDKENICEGNSVTLSASVGWDNYQWNGGQGSGAIFTITPEKSGFVSLHAMTKKGCMKTDSLFIQLLPTDRTELFYTICETDSAAIFDRWEKYQGEYTQSYINQNGCDSIVQVILEVLPLPQPGLRADNLLICEGETINLVANEGLSNYLWSTGDQNVSAISVTPSQSLSYKLTVTSENGCQASDSLTISIIGKEITYRQVEICEGDSVQVADKWFKSAGVYTEEFQTSAGCIGAMEITVVSNPVPDLMLMSDKETICEGNSVTLSASVGWDNYQWNGGQGSGAIFTITPEKSGFVSLHAMTKKGCMKTDSLFIQLLPTDRTELFYTICETDSAAIFDRWEKYQGEYVYTYNNLNGCDSVVTALVEVLKSPETFFLSGEGEYSEEEKGRQIILEGSEPGVQYHLFSSEREESSLPGTGTALDFGIWEEGQYWVVAENKITQCSTLAGDTIKITKTGIEILKEFRVYPNPAYAEVFISTPAEGKLRIYNSKGQLVIYINGFSNKLINLGNLDQGIYLAVLQVYTKFYFTKFIKL
jgi:hypothetical protein